ncbi:MAG: glycerate kinase [Deltaproteobacteria bacterium]
MIIIAPDKFKGSLTSPEVCNIIESGIRSVLPKIKIMKFPFADGGDGFLEIMNYYKLHLTKKEIFIKDPLLKKSIKTKYLTENNIAYIGTADSSGLNLIVPELRNPMNTSTFGLGQVIKDALDSNINEIYVGLGGSSTTDGGTGIAYALGYRFYDANNSELQPIGKNLIKIKKIIKPQTGYNAKIYAVVDVQSSFYGPSGSALVFAAQKGASKRDIQILEEGMKNLAKVINDNFDTCINSIPGSGAAGGAGGGLHVFANAQIIDGTDFVRNISGINDYWDQCMVLITGEGKIDYQTELGKLSFKLASEALKHKAEIIAIAGLNELTKKKYSKLGFSKIYQLKPQKMSIEDSIKNTPKLLFEKSKKIANKLKRLHQSSSDTTF